MLRTAITVAACVVSTAALASNFPVRPGITYCGDNSYVSATSLGGEDYKCSLIGEALPSVPFTVTCKWVDDETGSSAENMTITLLENPDENTLLWQYVEDDGVLESETLIRCE